MQIFPALVLSLCVYVARAEKCEEGVVKVEKLTEFKCHDGLWAPVACLVDGKRLEDAKVVVTDQYMFQCQKVAPNQMTMVPVACVHKGRLVMPSQSVTIGHAYYSCLPGLHGETMVLRVAGCVVPNGERVPIAAKMDVGQYYYVCSNTGESASLQPAGCIHQGRSMALNETVTEHDFWRICRLDENAGITLAIAGCVDAGMRLNPDEIYHTEGIIYKCLMENGSMKAQSIGCLEVTPSLHYVEHMLEEKWFEGSKVNGIQYEMQCSQDVSGVFKWAVRCFFENKDLPASGMWLDPMCMKKVSGKLYQCVRGDNRLLLSNIVEHFSDDSVKESQKNGLGFCE